MANTSLTFLPFIKRQPALPIVESKPGQLTAKLNLKIIDSPGREHQME
jgi:hypothetical protein